MNGSVEAADYTETEEFKKTIERVERWRDLVNQVQREEGYDFDTDIILSIIAAESRGHPRVVNASSGATGLMQCIPQPWTASQERLKIPKVNIQCGLWILDNSMRTAGGDWFTALRYYLCGPELGREWQICGARYADKVLKFWLPFFDRYDSHPSMLFWLRDNGYLDEIRCIRNLRRCLFSRIF